MAMMRTSCSWPSARVGSRALVLALLATAVALPSPAAAAAKKRTCFPAHSTTIAASKSVRVFHTRRSGQDLPTYGCLLSSKHPFRFAPADFPPSYGPIVIAGRFVAYGVSSDCAAGFCDPNNVVVQDLRNGRRTYVDGTMLRVANVTSLVLRSNGSVAWIESSFDEGGSTLPGYVVVSAARGKGPVVLDSGTDVVPGSLALAGSTIYWTKGTTAASSTLS